MKLKIHIFDSEERAVRLKDLKGDKATLYECTNGAKIYDFANLDFEGETDDEVWIVTVKEED